MPFIKITERGKVVGCLKKGVILVLLTVLVLSLTACGEKGSTLDQAIDQGYITVGFANEKPYAYKDENGELTGEAVEIAKVILERLGVKEMKGELTEFGSLIAGLQADRFDMITAGMFINPNRCSAVLFADPEYSIGESLAVKQGNPLNLTSYEDIAADDNAKVAVMTGAVEIGYMEESGVPSDRIVQVPDQASAISALQADRVQAITMTGPSLTAMLESASDDQIERVEGFKQPVIDGESVRGYGATAFRQADTEFQEAYNAELTKMKESGELLEILQEFGFTEEELPGEMTAAALCGE
ncbi:ectoine/hydroxyectoine ABC transporter substrate-binding protein EhuB [Paenibacillus urinalis]|uniref:Ectoine/hydroxyectoine ABC transporter substrate-binding protein EhuB n=1 Tax=Paenibacillus urinalis TaxID=521520 RepID=A0ABY7X6P7_9BACL|nr:MULTISPECIES: ectoine/hydroxyectoine ABC transporter substrate-binding protein EhuB [Paenibacillus]WDH96653.1 ectoine/hydroxyectoine ABC transporter substrate-binding protein EhuB [Paenibacillus urinalis]WDI00297.1 ectoine/hydroxyectoine ABC transporter substrate-binding protein EhuB [Paenibacillus urinalis]GAK40807.1 amino acid ABC transporter amino acid-binding protein [Paenibacillus sp. TCA20]